jgi:hypothetical protein
MTVLNLTSWEITNIGHEISSKHTLSRRANNNIIDCVRLAVVSQNTLLSCVNIHADECLGAVGPNIGCAEVHLLVVGPHVLEGLYYGRGGPTCSCNVGILISKPGTECTWVATSNYDGLSLWHVLIHSGQKVSEIGKTLLTV